MLKLILLLAFIGCLTVPTICQILEMEEFGDDNSNETVKTTAAKTIDVTTKAVSIDPSSTAFSVDPVVSSTAIPSENFKSAEDGSWAVTDSKVTCILLNMATCFKIKYDSSDNTRRIAKLCIPKEAKVGPKSACDNDTNIIELVFGPHQLTLNFEKGSDNKVEVTSGELSYKLTKDIFNQAKHLNEMRMSNFSGVEYFQYDTDRSYKCKHQESLKLDDTVTMTLKNFQVEAFRTSKTSKFSDASICKDDRKLDYLLPVICSIVLGGLVAIILIVYGIARFRISRANYDDLN